MQEMLTCVAAGLPSAGAGDVDEGQEEGETNDLGVGVPPPLKKRRKMRPCSLHHVRTLQARARASFDVEQPTEEPEQALVEHQTIGWEVVLRMAALSEEV